MPELCSSPSGFSWPVGYKSLVIQARAYYSFSASSDANDRLLLLAYAARPRVPRKKGTASFGGYEIFINRKNLEKSPI